MTPQPRLTRPRIGRSGRRIGYGAANIAEATLVRVENEPG